MVLLVILAKESANAADSLVDPFQSGGEICSVASACSGQRPRLHHGDVGSVLVELDLVALAGGVLDHEGKEPQVPFRVPHTRS